MKIVKVGVLAAVALIAVLAFAGPAFATPTGTVGNGNAPFITPAGNTTTSSITGSGVNSTFAVGSFNVTCSVTGSGYIPATIHTEAHITSLAFTACTSTLGTATVNTACVKSSPSWGLHVKGTVTNGSSVGTVNLGCPAVITITALGGLVTCTETVATGVSVDGTFTNTTDQLVVSDTTVAYTRAGSTSCPASGNATQTGTITFKADTATDNIAVTNAS